MTPLSSPPDVLRAYSESECGADGYPFAWHQVIKHQVRDEAERRCARCRHPYEPGMGQWSTCDELCTHDGPMQVVFAPDTVKSLPELSAGFVAGDVVRIYADMGQVEAAWRILTVHHLDGDKRNCRWWNLAALCQRCHLTIQGKVKMHQTYPWEHAEWFKPYAAGYYALSYLGEELNRADTLARLEELLSLEHVA